MFVLQILKRNEVLYSLSPASSRCATLAYSHRMRSWPRGGTPRQALAHSKFVLHSTSTLMVMCCPDTHTACLPPRQTWILSLGDREREKPTNTRPGPQTRSNQAGQPSDSHQQARGRDPSGNPQRREQATLLQDLTRQVFRRPSFLVSTLVGERKVFGLASLAKSLPRLSGNTRMSDRGGNLRGF